MMAKIAIIRNDQGYLGEYILSRLVHLLKDKCIIIDAWKDFPHDVKTWSISNNIKGVILSGSLASVNDDNEWIDEELEFVGRFMDLHLSILGICFGHQILGKYFGANIERKNMRSGLAKIKIIKEDTLFGGITNFQMPVSHSEQLSWLPKGFELLATSDYCKIQAMKHRDSNIYGVQFHPCYDADVKKIRELGITDMNYAEHEGAMILYNFLKITGI